jgi:glyoxylase-like metal-dependent hydrolase (beta-lactamase superfamily II)
MPAHAARRCRLAVGELDVAFLPDGYITSTPQSSYPGSKDAIWQANPHLLDDRQMLVMSLGALLVRTRGRVILVDLGWGPGEMDLVHPATGEATGHIAGGSLLDSLASEAVHPEDVDTVVFSHLHRDHTGWLARDDGSLWFPNARHLLAEAEWQHWATSGQAGIGPAPTEAQLAALGGRFEPLLEGDRIAPGIDVMATPGHTPGHLSFVLSSGTERAIVLGDAVHCPIEILEPELEFVVDVDPALARRTRARIGEELLEPGTFAAAVHFPDFVFGRLLAGNGRPLWQFPESQLAP